MSLRLVSSALMTLWIAAPILAQESRPAEGAPAPPEGFKQVIPRGRIAAIRDPHYVSADQAVITPEAWVLGVVIEGQARAYSLSILNRHEIVNDQVGDTPFAAVW